MDFVVPPRQFSLREANACVPLLERTFSKARKVKAVLDDLQEQLRRAGHPLDHARIRVDPSAPARVQALQTDASDCVAELLELLGGVTELGAEVKAAEGLVDFRSRLDGRVVYLCWRAGEESITHYHELDTGFAGRAPLPAEAVFEGDPLH